MESPPTSQPIWHLLLHMYIERLTIILLDLYSFKRTLSQLVALSPHHSADHLYSDNGGDDDHLVDHVLVCATYLHAGVTLLVLNMTVSSRSSKTWCAGTAGDTALDIDAIMMSHRYERWYVTSASHHRLSSGCSSHDQRLLSCTCK